MQKQGLDEKSAAAYIGCSYGAMRLWRTQGRGPRFYRGGRLIRYRKSELDKWIEKQSRDPWQGEGGDTNKPN